MRTPIHISNKDARRLLLYLHGLSFAVHRKLTSRGLLELIEDMGFVQVDSINTIERAHHMILFTRDPTYRQGQLAHLLEKERSLFENWTHDAAIIPMRFYRTVECADGGQPRPMFARSDLVKLMKDIPSPPKGLRFLSPFDPLIRDRLRTRRIFNFDYRVEVFVPAAQRQYGYYVFPMLQGDRFIGRIDMKHRRQEGKLLVTGLWLEAGQQLIKGRQHDLGMALERLRQFIGADAVAFANGYLKA
jgi:uncharacterized protein YcaQ